MRTIQPKILEVPEIKVEWKENFWEKVSENLGTPREVVHVLEIFEKCCSTRYWKLRRFKPHFFVERKAP